MKIPSLAYLSSLAAEKPPLGRRIVFLVQHSYPYGQRLPRVEIHRISLPESLAALGSDAICAWLSTSSTQAYYAGAFPTLEEAERCAALVALENP